MNSMAKYIVIVAVTIAAAYGITWYLRPVEIPPGITLEAKPSSEIKNETKVEMPIRAVKVYKPAVKSKLKLPAAVVQDQNTHVIASSKTPNDEHPHTITTTVNATTGETVTYDRIDPLPWVAINTKSELGLYAGYKRGEQIVRIEGRQEVLQIKSLHIGAIASADMARGETDGFVGAGIWARW